jgi:excisionase family DNA binding protein
VINLEELLDALADRVVTKLQGRLGRADSVQPRLLTVKQAAEYVARSEQAVQHLIASGKLRTVRSDRRVFLDREDLDRWIEENKQEPI